MKDKEKYYSGVIPFDVAVSLKGVGFPQCKKNEEYRGLKYTVDGKLTTAPYADSYRAVTYGEVMGWLIGRGISVEVKSYGMGWCVEVVEWRKRRQPKHYINGFEDWSRMAHNGVMLAFDIIESRKNKKKGKKYEQWC